MLLWKNSYVFTQPKEKFTSSLKYGWFYLSVGGFFALLFIGSALKNVSGLINTALLCFLIGIYEEFLLRGWLLTEFLERYGSTKKGVWTSIVASGVIFGLIHFINISSMGFASTLTQVLSACATGIVFGLIYYKTKNIWTVVFLHGFWDFCIFLSELEPLQTLIANDSSVSILSIVISILIALSELIIVIPFIKNIDDNVPTKKIIKYSIIAGFTFFFSMIGSSYASPSETIKQEIGNLNIEEYAITFDNYETYDINYKVKNDPIIEYTQEGEEIQKELPDTTYSFSLYKTNSLLTLKNNNTNQSMNIEYNNIIDYAIYEIENNYIIVLVDIDKNGNNIIKYNILNKEEITDKNEYLEKIVNNMKTLLLGDYGELCSLRDKKTNKIYVCVKSTNYGYFILEEGDKISLLNRD